MTNHAASATASSPLVTLLVVDDHTLFRRGLIALLSQYEGLSVVCLLYTSPSPRD